MLIFFTFSGNIVKNTLIFPYFRTILPSLNIQKPIKMSQTIGYLQKKARKFGIYRIISYFCSVQSLLITIDI